MRQQQFRNSTKLAVIALLGTTVVAVARAQAATTREPARNEAPGIAKFQISRQVLVHRQRPTVVVKPHCF